MAQRWIFTIAAAWLLLVCALLPAEDWPSWRGPRADGTWNGPAIADKLPPNGIQTLWKQPIGGGYAGVTVVGDQLFTMDRRTEEGEQERVLAFQASTGKPLWTHPYAAPYKKLDYGNGPRAAPTFHEGKLYTLGAMGHVHCLEASSGKVIWTHDTVAAYDAKVPAWGMAASPVIYKNLVIFHVGAQPGGSLLAMDKNSGKLVWKGSNEAAGYCTPIIVSHGGKDLLLHWGPTNIQSIDPATGAVHWSYPYEIKYGVSIATPIFQEGIYFIAGYWDGSRAIELGERPQDFKLAWQDKKYLNGLMSQPLYRDGHVYLLDKFYGLTCFKLKTGVKVWDDGKRATPGGANPQASLVWTGDSDRALILNSEGQLILAKLNPAGYQELWRAPIIGKTWAHPAYAGNRVYARSDTELVCVQLPAP